jgi:hypothetical protein
MLTWAVPGGGEWRFTLHAYPFYLLAAFWLLDRLVRRAWASGREGFSASLTALYRKETLVTATVLTMLLVAAVGWTFGMPYLIARESLLAGEGAGIIASDRDRWLFNSGWSDLVVSGNIVARFTTEPRATLRIPLPENRAYRLILRMDPLYYPGAPPQRVRVLVNQHPVGILDLGWNPERVGEYQLLLPRDAIRLGANEVSLWSDVMAPIGRTGTAFPEIPRAQAVGLRLWYLRIVPDDGRAHATS